MTTITAVPLSPNTPLIDPAGQVARLIQMPIPGRPVPYGVILYPDGRAVVVDLRLCNPASTNLQTA